MAFEPQKCDVAVDMGSSTTRIYIRDKGVVMRQPTFMVFKRGEKKPVCAGDEANTLYGCKPDGLRAVRPIRNGIVADAERARQMLEWFFKHCANCKPRSRITVGIRPDLTQLQRMAVEEALPAGSRPAYIRQPLASALGAGVDVKKGSAQCVVDIGAGSTDIGVFACGGAVDCRSIDMAGDAMDAAIANYVRGTYGIFIDPRMAERVKIQLGSAKKPYIGRLEVRGRDAHTGFASARTLSGEEVAEVLARPVGRIVDAVVRVIEELPAELSGDLVKTGITLTGGGSLMWGMDELLAEATGLDVRVAPLCLDCAISGMARAMQHSLQHAIA